MTPNKTLCEYVADYLREELDAVHPDPIDRPNLNSKRDVKQMVNEAIDAYVGGAR